MSESYKHDRGALVALSVIIGAVVLLAGISALTELLDRPVSVPIRNPDQHHVDSDYHIWGDSWAQWSMAAIAVLATGVSWRALYLLRRTFEETKRTADAALEANQVARDVGGAQVRAYVGVSTISATIVGDLLHEPVAYASVKVKNNGQTPARDLRFRGFLKYHEPGTPNARELAIELDSNPADLGVGEDRVVFNEHDNLTPLEVAAIENGKAVLILAGTLWYGTVTGKRRYTHYYLILTPRISLTKDRDLLATRIAIRNRAN